jgi:ribosomal protein L11 methyltransferase
VLSFHQLGEAVVDGMDVLVRVVVDDGDAVLTADRLWMSGATAVEQRDSDPSPGCVTLLAGFPTHEGARRVADGLRELGADLLEVDNSWVDVWKQYASPVAVDRLVVAPAWQPYPVELADGRLVLSIDSGAVFGSGTHPSTRLLLGQLVHRLTPDSRVFDVGTGSGILAIAAARLGAERVTAVDVDPDAVATAKRNAAANGVGDRIEVSTDPAESIDGPFNVVMANLTAAVLASLAATLVAAVGPDGLVLLSGMLPGQWDHIADRFASLELLEVPGLDGWAGAVLHRTELQRTELQRR